MKTSKSSHSAPRAKSSRAIGLADKYVLRLFVAGATSRSRLAILHVQQLCATELAAGCRLEVVDIYQQPKLARAHQIVATPTLVRELPRPVRRFIGNMLNTTGLFDEFDVAPGENVVV